MAGHGGLGSACQGESWPGRRGMVRPVLAWSASRVEAKRGRRGLVWLARLVLSGMARPGMFSRGMVGRLGMVGSAGQGTSMCGEFRLGWHGVPWQGGHGRASRIWVWRGRPG